MTLRLAYWLLAFSARAPFFSDRIEMDPSKSVWSSFLQFGFIFWGFKPLTLTSIRKIFGITVLIEDGESSHHLSSSHWDLVPSSSFGFVYSQPKLRHPQISAVPKLQTQQVTCLQHVTASFSKPHCSLKPG